MPWVPVGTARPIVPDSWKSPGKGPSCLLIAGARSENPEGDRPPKDRAEVVGEVEQGFGAVGHTKPQPGICPIYSVRAPPSRPIDAIFDLEASSWHHEARVGDVRTIRSDLGRVGRAVLGSPRIGNSRGERADHQRECNPERRHTRANGLRHPRLLRMTPRHLRFVLLGSPGEQD